MFNSNIALLMTTDGEDGDPIREQNESQTWLGLPDPMAKLS